MNNKFLNLPKEKKNAITFSSQPSSHYKHGIIYITAYLYIVISVILYLF
ncbi:hypothetical protein [Clostridium sulfidigenes]|nr:hypothetical protein [Clostridium sulfidigenes]